METSAQRLGLGVTALTAIAVTALAACSLPEALVYPADPAERCGPQAAAQLATADPARLRVIDITISEGEFAPMVITLRERRLYLFRIKNTDNEDRLFAAPGFLFHAAIGDLSIGERHTQATCLDRIHVPAGEMTTVTLMPLRAGAYELEDAFILPSGGIGIGTIRVVPDYSIPSDTLQPEPA